MEVKPEYKQTDSGKIPKDWEVKTLHTIATITSGKRLPEGYSVTNKATPHPYIRVTDMRPGTIETRDIKYVPLGAYPSIKNYRIFKEDIFISVAGSLGVVGKIPPELDGANLTENANRISEIRCNRDYLLHCLMSSRIQNEINSNQTIGAQPKLALSRIRNFRIPIPKKLEEQHAIATAINDMNEFLERLNTLITKKRAIKQATMQQLLSEKTRFPGFKESWKEFTLGEHLTFLKNGINSRAELSGNKGVRYLHYGDIHTSPTTILDAQIKQMPFLSHDKAIQLDRLKNGDLVFVDVSEDITGIGKSIEIKNAENIEIVSGLHTIATRFDKRVLADGFKSYLQFIPRFQRHLQKLAAGTKVYATNRSHISSARLKLPDVEEQIAISSLLFDMESEVTALEVHYSKTLTLKQAMMQELLTGRTRLV